jgi:anti-sigma B factor antagonist
MTTALRITTGKTPEGTARLSAAGEIDLSNADQFRTALAEAVRSDRRLVVDLTEVDYLDSAALATLFAHADHIDVHISPLNEALFTFSGLGELTTIRVVPAAPGAAG